MELRLVDDSPDTNARDRGSWTIRPEPIRLNRGCGCAPLLYGGQNHTPQTCVPRKQVCGTESRGPRGPVQRFGGMHASALQPGASTPARSGTFRRTRPHPGASKEKEPRQTGGGRSEVKGKSSKRLQAGVRTANEVPPAGRGGRPLDHPHKIGPR